MKHVVLSALVAFSFNANAYEYMPEVEEIGTSGGYTINHLAQDCSSEYPDMLIMPGQFGKDGVCMSQIRFDEKAYDELDQMESEQYDNDSDYDSRITDVFAFEHEDFLTWNGTVTEGLIEHLNEAFNLAEGAAENFQVRVMNLKKDPLYPFHGYLFLGGMGEAIEDYQIGQELTELLAGEQGIHLSFRKEVGLYPGGGINVTYHFFMMDGKTVYVKEVHWDA
jgi:hypothetical protein